MFGVPGFLWRDFPMLAIARATLALLAVSLAFASPGALAQRTSVLAGGTADAQGVGKLFWLQATQNTAGSQAATGSAFMMQMDSTNVWGDFSLIANVVCLKAEGPRVTAGLQIAWGLGTALGRAGNMIYVVLESGTGPGGSDLLDNGGYELGAPNCDTVIGVPGGGAPFVSGQVSITAVP